MSTRNSAGHVFITHPIHADARAILAAANLEADVVDAASAPLPLATIRERAARAAALIAFMPDTVDAAFLDACPLLRIVSGALRGGDNFDIAAMSKRGIYFSRCGDLLTAPTAELAVSLATSLARHVAEGDARVRSGSFAGWRPELFGAGLDGATVGIIGLGAVGRALAERLRGFGVARFVWCDEDAGAAAWAAAAAEAWACPAGRAPGARPPPAFERVADARAVLRAADYAFPLTPLMPATRHLVDAAALAGAKRGAFLINVGRGGCVDEGAVADALASGALAGYAADVFELEDWALADRRRDIPAALLADSARTLFTPHLGSAVVSVRREIDMTACENVVDVLVRGVAPRGAVNAPLSVDRGTAT